MIQYDYVKYFVCISIIQILSIFLWWISIFSFDSNDIDIKNKKKIIFKSNIQYYF